MKGRKVSFVILTLLCVFLFGGATAKAGEMEIHTYIDNPFTASWVGVTHREGVAEGYDGADASWLETPDDNNIECYSLIPGYKLRQDERPSNSTSTFLIIMDTRGSVGGGDSYINFDIIDMGYFEWKNIFADRYGTSDVNDPNNIIGTWDVKYIEAEPVTWDDAVNLGFIPAETSGVYDQFKIKFYNHADLNRDRKVNLLDFAIFSTNWQRTGIDKGSDPTALDDYADIDGSGTVDILDLSAFVLEWLWDADDPSTW